MERRKGNRWTQRHKKTHQTKQRAGNRDPSFVSLAVFVCGHARVNERSVNIFTNQGSDEESEIYKEPMKSGEYNKRSGEDKPNHKAKRRVGNIKGPLERVKTRPTDPQTQTRNEIALSGIYCL